MEFTTGVHAGANLIQHFWRHRHLYKMGMRGAKYASRLYALRRLNKHWKKSYKKIKSSSKKRKSSAPSWSNKRTKWAKTNQISGTNFVNISRRNNRLGRNRLSANTGIKLQNPHPFIFTYQSTAGSRALAVSGKTATDDGITSPALCLIRGFDYEKDDPLKPGTAPQLKDVNGNDVPCNVKYKLIKIDCDIDSVSKKTGSYCRIVVVRDLYRSIPGLPGSLAIRKSAGGHNISETDYFFTNPFDRNEPVQFTNDIVESHNIVSAPINSRRYQVLYSKVIKLVPVGDHNAATNINYTGKQSRKLTIKIPLKKTLRYENNHKHPTNESLKVFCYGQLSHKEPVGHTFDGVDLFQVNMRVQEYYDSRVN